MALDNWQMVNGDDYTVGTVTVTAGSVNLSFENSGIKTFGAIERGDTLFIPATGAWLPIAEVEDDENGKLMYPAPSECAGTFDVRVRFMSRGARDAGLAAMTFRNLQGGNLPALSGAKLENKDLIMSNGNGQFVGLPSGILKELSSAVVNDGQAIVKNGLSFEGADIFNPENKDVLTEITKQKTVEEWADGKSSSVSAISPSSLISAIIKAGFLNDEGIQYNLPDGWIKFFGVLIVQWGEKAVTDPINGADIEFPVAFPNKRIVFTASSPAEFVSNSHFLSYFESLNDYNKLDRTHIWLRRSFGEKFEASAGVIKWIAIGY